MEIVVADIGGTHARFALAEVADGCVEALDDPATLRTAEYASFQTAWEAFAQMVGRPLPRAASIAVACPVRGDVLQLTNNPWVIHPALIGGSLGLDAHVLINDFEAVGHAAAQVDASNLRHIAGPDVSLPALGSISIIGPGTGLGVAQVLRLGGAVHVLPCEGGHADFAPVDAIDDMVLANLRQRHRRVSIERVVSGPGLVAIYHVLGRIEGRDPVVIDVKALWTSALARQDSLASAALDRFCLSLGSVAGDFALSHGSSGVVVAGGLGLRLADHLPRSGFAARFVAKGRFEAMLAAMPVKLITHPQPGLFGAAAAFARSQPC